MIQSAIRHEQKDELTLVAVKHDATEKLDCLVIVVLWMYLVWKSGNQDGKENWEDERRSGWEREEKRVDGMVGYGEVGRRW